MFARWGVVFWFVATEAIRPHGPAPFANTTSIASYALNVSSTHLTTSSAASDGLPTITSRPSTSETESPSLTSSINSTWNPNGTWSANSTNFSASPCTVNIPNAKLEWWYAATYSSALGTLTTAAPNFTQHAGDYLTLIPGQGTFDVSSAVSSGFGWTESVVQDTVWGDWTNYELYTVVPTAAATSVITRNAAPPLPSGNIVPVTEVYSYLWMDELPPASITFANTANATSAVTSATPFLYFTAYEVESAINGSATTSTVSLAQPTAIEYAVKGIENYASIIDIVPEEFLLHINQSTCAPGTVQGEVTVLVVLDVYWFRPLPFNFPFLIHIESSVLGFDVTDTELVVFAETSRGTPFTIGAGNPKWTEDLGKTTQIDDEPGSQTVRLQTIQGPQQTAPAAPLAEQTVGTIGTNHVVVAPSSKVVVGTQTLKPGAPPVTIDGSRVSLAPSATAIVVEGSTLALPIVADPGSPTKTIGTIGGRPMVVDASSAVRIGTATLKPGQPPVTIGGTTVSVAPSGSAIVVEGQTSALPRVIFPAETIQTHEAAPILTVGSSTFTANAATQFSISPGQTLTPGGTATIDGTAVSLGPSASFIVIGGLTQILPTGIPGATPRPEFVFGGATITALPNSNNNRHGVAPLNDEDAPSGPTFVIAGQTLAPGHAITADGTTVSLAPSGSFIVINGVTSTLLHSIQMPLPQITVGGSVYSPLPATAGSYMIGTALLTPGGEVTVSGTTISLASDGSDVVIDGVTYSVPGHAHAATGTNPPLLTIGSQTYTAAAGTGTTFVVGGKTLTPGGMITVDGTTISLASDATKLIYGSAGTSTTEALFPATTTTGPFTTGSVTASASAGASGSNGQAAATSTTTGAGCDLQPPKFKSWMLFAIIAILGLWVR